MPLAPATQASQGNSDAIQAFFEGYSDALIGKLAEYRVVDNPWIKWALVVPSAPKNLHMYYSSYVPEWQTDIGRRDHQLPTIYPISYARGTPDTMDMGEFMDRLETNTSYGASIISPIIQGNMINNKTPYAMATKVNAGFTTDAWDGRDFWVLNTANPTTEMHLVNRGKPSLGSYYTARENFSPTAPNISTLLQDLISRKGYDGKPLGTQRKAFVWGPTEKRIEFEDLLKRVEWSTTSGTGGNNTALQRAEFIEIPGLRSDLWGVGVDPATVWELAFVLMLGAMPNSTVPKVPMIQGWQLDLQGKDTTPHRLVELVDETSALSVMGRWVGVRVKVNETVHLHSPAALMGAFTGAAS